MTTGPFHLEVTLPSDIQRGLQVQEQILVELHRRGYGEHDCFCVRLALEEGIINAIKHGNKFDAAKSVKIVATVSDTEANFLIEDEGTGFRPEEVPDPTADENLEKPSGRGLMLMRSFMSAVDYNQRGNRLTMSKARTRES